MSVKQEADNDEGYDQRGDRTPQKPASAAQRIATLPEYFCCRMVQYRPVDAVFSLRIGAEECPVTEQINETGYSPAQTRNRCNSRRGE